MQLKQSWIEEKTYAEIDNLLSKLQNQLTRHFEVRKYKKGKLLGKD
ncbi:MAG: hypothetical protein GX638_06645 [Crenarchaeota archaeon]|nr:hypothetical protein [Thermoproteota archaeon]